MSEKDSSNKNDPSNGDEDFGLPKVKFTPIGPEKKVPEEKTVNPEIKAGNTSKLKSKDAEREEKKGNGFLIILLLLIVALGLGSLYYFGFFESNQVPTQTDVPTPTETESSVPQVAETDDTANGIPEPEVTENVLTEITSRAASPRYFVVVGSFIDDDLAKDYSTKLNKLGNPTFLIHPYGEKAFYRLAVAQYDNVTRALEVMEDQQGNFEENLWVLKY
ncbi:SPOR domain-containing protein [Lunatibacter salilacus]|uniref:SPOR domain-containing protein n=1 Tax=Lunatibacter salilacus TaxID=2483804 RepID=UPI00131DA144|nr:SPOR domain-containing protein [Lunatibacter salilacus]